MVSVITNQITSMSKEEYKERTGNNLKYERGVDKLYKIPFFTMEKRVWGDVPILNSTLTHEEVRTVAQCRSTEYYAFQPEVVENILIHKFLIETDNDQFVIAFSEPVNVL